MSKVERKTYTREYKQEAVRLAQESELPLTQIARQLGIHRNMLAKWSKEVAQLGAKSHAPSQEDAASEKEVEQLRQEVKALRQERDILKKALVIISREQA